MNNLRPFTLVASMALLLQVACSGNTAITATTDTASSQPPDRDATQAVAITLPVANRIALIDPFEGDTWELSSVPSTEVNALNGIAESDGGLAVVGTGNDRIALLDEETGELLRSAPLAPPSTGIALEAGWYLVVEASHLLATADAFRGVGYLFKLDAETLQYEDSVEIGFGQNGIALDQRGRLWSLGVEGSSTTTVSIVDIDGMEAVTLPLRGYPAGIAPGPNNLMYATLREKAQVVALSQEGNVVRRMSTGDDPWGIAIREDGLGVVVADGGTIGPSRSAQLIDFENLRVQTEIQLQGCPDAREVVIVENRAVVICAGLPGALILDLQKEKVLEIIRFSDPRQIEQPRTPVLIDLE
jgi:DNA-binding beta-propeller fold protein YncE